MAREEFASIETTASHAEALLAQGRYSEAERYFRDLVGQTHVIDYEYDDWLRRLAEIYEVLKRARAAGYIYLYLHYFDPALEAFSGEDGLVERARVLEVLSRSAAAGKQPRRWLEAAELYASAAMPVHAAVAYERSGDLKKAAATWAALGGDARLRPRPYEQALVYFNHGMVLTRLGEEPNVARRALVDSQRRLEQVADDFESRGERERAFDCYQILLKLGRDSGQFENLAEGYLNCIRILKDDNLKFYVLQYYEDFITLALQRGEFYAAATLFQEAADYTLRNGLPYDRHYQARAAETWVRCAEKNRHDGAPIELAENALLAAVSCYSAVGDYGRVKELFQKLAALEISDKKTARYGAIAGRYPADGQELDDAPEFPDYLKQQHAYADIWFVDLLEWELGGDPLKVAASILGDLRYPDGIRRRALVIALTMEAAAGRGDEASEQVLAGIAELLGELQSYAALSPLERLFGHASAAVRRAAVRALRFLFFKRSFVLIRRALADRDEGVREAAMSAMSGLHFPHAFNPLARVYREVEDARVQAVALESIGKIQSIEAGEFLLMVLRQEEGALRDVAKRALASLDNTDMVPILRQHYQIETSPEIRDILEELVRGGRAA